MSMKRGLFCPVMGLLCGLAPCLLDVPASSVAATPQPRPAVIAGLGDASPLPAEDAMRSILSPSHRVRGVRLVHRHALSALAARRDTVFAARLASRLRQVVLIELDSPAEIPGVLSTLRRHPHVAWAEANGVMRQAATFPDDDRFPDQWGLHNTGQEGGTADADIDAPEAWDVTMGSEDIVIAIVDSGVDLDHEELSDRITLVAGSDLVNGDNTPDDDSGHGTHVAGTSAARGQNGRGVAGVCWECRIMPIKVLDASGTGTFDKIAAGIALAAAAGARVINLSLGSHSPSESIADAIAVAADAGAVVVAAAGNEGTDQPFYPAADVGVVAVAALGRDGERASFSSYGSWVDQAAPGVEIWSTVPGDAYAIREGTSMAAPFVSGALGLLAAAHPDWNPHLLAEHLRRTSKASVARNGGTGAGLISADAALRTAVSPEASVAQTAVSDPGGDGDGRLDLTDGTVTLTVALRSDYGNLTSLRGTLTTQTAGVAISDSAGTWDDLPSGATASNAADGFALTVAGPLQAGDDISLTLELAADGEFAASFPLSLRIDGGVELPTNIFCTDTTLAANVYMVREDVAVCENTVLTLEPGTEFRFVRRNPAITFTVNGTLAAEGEENGRIRFTSAESAPAAGDWGVLHLTDTSPDAVGWEAAESIPVGMEPYGLASGDTDGDGDTDLLVATSLAQNSVTISRWEGSSWASTSAAVGLEPVAVAVGDADNDGSTDIVVANESSNDLTILRWNGIGWDREDFGDQDVPASVPQAVAIGDADNDGENEVVAALGGLDVAAVFEWTVGAGWQRTDLAVGSWARGVAIGDADNDGDNDIVVSNGLGSSVSFVAWSGSTWDPQVEIPVAVNGASGPWGVAIGDVDGDGDQDIAAASTGNGTTLPHAVSALRWTAGRWVRSDLQLEDATPMGLALADVGGSSTPEILVSIETGYGSSPSAFNVLPWGGAPQAASVGVQYSGSPGITVIDLGADGLRVAVAMLNLDVVQTFRPRQGTEGSRLAHVDFEYGGGLQLSATSPAIIDAAFRHQAAAIAGDSASHPAIDGLTVEDPSGTTVVSGGTGTVLANGLIPSGMVTAGAIQDSTLSNCSISAQFVSSSTLDSCSSITARLVGSSVTGGESIIGDLDDTTVSNCGTVSAATIVSSTITGCSGGVANTTTVVDSTIADNGAGISKASGTISGTLVLRNGGPGVSGAAAIADSTIVGNTGSGVVAGDAALPGNASAERSIIDNGDGTVGRYAVANTASTPASFLGNYWGTAATAQMVAADTDADGTNDENADIEAIYDWFDTATALGKVTYDQWLSAPPTSAPAYLMSVALDPPSPVSAQPVSFTFRFSRSMDTAVTPDIAFELSEVPEIPSAEFPLENPVWSTTAVENDTLTMSHAILTETPDGTHRIVVSGAVDSAGRTIPDDRSATFVIDTPVGIARGVALGFGAFRHGTIGRTCPGGDGDGGAAILSWQQVAENDLGGYDVLWGLGATQLASSQDAELATSATVCGLSPGVTYYFAVQTREKNGNSGPISEIVSGTVPIPPGQVPLGEGAWALAMLLALGLALPLEWRRRGRWRPPKRV
ncbi:MAG: S8 family serine peptidase [Candidatus Schekmanbacteria bacterium]|nr:S8 family serine peptidase [Candidatus Schekmanbacteria bacterium]